MSRFTRALAAAGAIALVGALSACSNSTDPAATDGSAAADEVIKIGVVGASDPQWELFKTAAADEGIKIEVVDFGEYTAVNPATTAGDIQINQFQHLPFLAQYNVDTGSDLQPIGATAIYPLGLYSQKYTDVASIPTGAKVGVPNDTTNQARGLVLLQAQGLVKLTDGGTAFSTAAEVDKAASKVEVVTIDADKIGASLPDLDAAIINNDFIEQAGFTADQAIAQDDPSDPKALPYVNVFATTAEQKDNPTYLKLVEIFQSNQGVLDAVQEQSGGTAVFLQTPASELQSTLATVESDYKATK